MKKLTHILLLSLLIVTTVSFAAPYNFWINISVPASGPGFKSGPKYWGGSGISCSNSIGCSADKANIWNSCHIFCQANTTNASAYAKMYRTDGSYLYVGVTGLNKSIHPGDYDIPSYCIAQSKSCTVPSGQSATSFQQTKTHGLVSCVFANGKGHC